MTRRSFGCSRNAEENKCTGYISHVCGRFLFDSKDSDKASSPDLCLSVLDILPIDEEYTPSHNEITSPAVSFGIAFAKMGP
mmetsp:Transcript_9279/g.5518  ORF Transcript_9279/g.5518 Transcript_9279/m.5518 type:complete len:81 (+) Transcript_9279:30-272(+)